MPKPEALGVKDAFARIRNAEWEVDAYNGGEMGVSDTTYDPRSIVAAKEVLVEDATVRMMDRNRAIRITTAWLKIFLLP